jgi:hypothetical protein
MPLISGVVTDAQRRPIADARVAFSRAPVSRPDAVNDDRARWMACMRRGDFEAAWQISDRIRPAPPLRGQRVLVRCDHGLGDTIQFIRYLPMLQRVARDVVIDLQPALRGAGGAAGFSVSSSRLKLAAPDDDRDRYDVELDVMDLPHAFRTTLETIPRSVPYLHADPLPRRWSGRHIGVAWHGGGWNHERDAPNALVAQLARLPGVVLYSLQEEHAGDLLHTARLIRSLDLVITVDSMPAHLAGALGVPVWTLLHADCDWRWMDEREDSPWYPTMRLFRQRTRGDWDGVIARLLRAVLEESSRTIASAARRA